MRIRADLPRNRHRLRIGTFPNERTSTLIPNLETYDKKFMKKPTHHIFVCGSYRPAGAQGVCHKKESSGLLQHLTLELQDRGLDDVLVSSTGCMNMCDNGPVIVVYPEALWYKHATMETADAILDSLEEGEELPEATLFA